MPNTQDTTSAEFDRIAASYQDFCRAVDIAKFHVAECLRNRPELKALESQFDSLAPQTLPILLNKLSSLEKAIRKASNIR